MSKAGSISDPPSGAANEPDQEEKKAGTAAEVMDGSLLNVDMEGYRQTTPLWKRVWQHSLTQMLLLSVQAFCGPAMDDAIAGKTKTSFPAPGDSGIMTACPC